MICYRDRAYCSASTDGRCVNIDCDRFVTVIERDASQREGLPLALADMSEGCGVMVRPEPLGRQAGSRPAL